MTADAPGQYGLGHPPPGGSDIIERARRACRLHSVSFEGTDPLSVHVPWDAAEELVQGLIGKISNSVTQIVPIGTRYRPDGGFSGRLWQNVAQHHLVERYYLALSGEENRLRAEELVEADKQHNLQSVHVPVNEWEWALQVPMSTLWLIDDKVVVRQNGRGPAAGSWLVTAQASEIERARVLREKLRDATAPSPIPDHRVGPDIAQLLLESAELVRHMAQMTCGGSRHLAEDNCSWYHGAWQYLRFLDMVSSPTWHAEFYHGELHRAIHDRGARKILISGAADWTTLAFVLDAAREKDGELVPDLDVHVIDLCPTPLMACHWFTKRWAGCYLESETAPVTTYRVDVTEWDELGKAGIGPEGTYDVIVADAFLTRFTATDTDLVLRSWFGLLRPGGTALTTVRLHPSNRYARQDGFVPEFDSLRRTTNPVDDFELRLRERIMVWRDMLAIGPEELARAGREYAKLMVSHDLGGETAIVNKFTNRGFRDIERRAARVQGELVGTEYLRVTARKDARPETQD